MSSTSKTLSDYAGKMTYTEFLDTVKVLKMLYGREIAEKFFTSNLCSWYNVGNASFLKSDES